MNTNVVVSAPTNPEHKRDKKSLKKAIRRAVFECMYTPDACTLEQNELHLLFVFDNLRRSTYGSEAWRLMDDELIFRRAVTMNKFEVFVPHDGIANPVMMDRPVRLHLQSPVVGELWLVSTRTIRSLDCEMYLNTEKMDRVWEHVRVTSEPEIPEYNVRQQVFGAWMYFGVHEYWNPFIDSGQYKKVEPSLPGAYRGPGTYVSPPPVLEEDEVPIVTR